jgi:ABC-2 type transport system permease protein
LRTLRVYLALAGAALRVEAQYRGNLALWILGGLAYQGVGFAFIWVIIGQFGSLAGWPLGEIAFLYGMRLTAHALFTVPCGQLFTVDYIIREGQFDRYLVRPVSPFIQVITGRLTLQALGDAAGGVILLAVAARLVPVAWTPVTIAYLIVALIGGALVEAGVQTLIASLAFRLLSANSLRALVDDILTTFGGYPLSILPIATRFGLTFIIPLAFIAYFPASVLLGRSGQLSVPVALAAVAPVAGAALFAVALWVWRREINHYTSSGH